MTKSKEKENLEEPGPAETIIPAPLPDETAMKINPITSTSEKLTAHPTKVKKLTSKKHKPSSSSNSNNTKESNTNTNTSSDSGSASTVSSNKALTKEEKERKQKSIEDLARDIVEKQISSPGKKLNIKKIAEDNKISRRTLARWVRVIKETGSTPRKKGRPCTLSSLEEVDLAAKVTALRNDQNGFLTSSLIVKEAVNMLSKSSGEGYVRRMRRLGGDRWVKNFMKRHNLELTPAKKELLDEKMPDVVVNVIEEKKVEEQIIAPVIEDKEDKEDLSKMVAELPVSQVDVPIKEVISEKSASTSVAVPESESESDESKKRKRVTPKSPGKSKKSKKKKHHHHHHSEKRD